jgi:hypothetical protein
MSVGGGKKVGLCFESRRRGCSKSGRGPPSPVGNPWSRLTIERENVQNKEQVKEKAKDIERRFLLEN